MIKERLLLKTLAKERRATTIMEVMFAIGIVMVGLVGIASLIPLAIRQASDSKVLTQSTSQAQNVYREFIARSYIVPRVERPWLFCEDRGNTRAYLPVTSFSDLVAYQASMEPIAAGLSTAFASRHSYCIDPIFWATQPDVPSSCNEQDIGASVDVGYRRSRFPFYHDRLNPLSGPLQPANDWPRQPRMIRIGFPEADTANVLVAFPPGGPNKPMRQQLAQRLFTNRNELTSIVSETDRSLNSVIGFKTITTGTGPQLAEAATIQDLSWFATLSPLAQDTLVRQNTYTLSVVMLNKRDRIFNVSSTTDSLNLPTSEIVAWAEPTVAPTTTIGSTAPLAYESNYSGNAGISVDLYGYAGPGMTDPAGDLRREAKVRVGSWIMLSRRFFFSGDPSAPTGEDLARSKDIFKWYRVIGVSENYEIGNWADPFGNSMSSPDNPKTWKQTVQLNGPDWTFQIRNPPSHPPLPPAATLPTTATIVPNVVTVYERLVELPAN